MGFKNNIDNDKLLVLMDEFEKLMKEHDLGGAIVIHHKNTSSFKAFMAPKYSIAQEKKDQDGNIMGYRFVTQGLPNDIKEQMIVETCNLFHTVSICMMNMGMGLAEVSEKLDGIAGAEYVDLE